MVEMTKALEESLQRLKKVTETVGKVYFAFDRAASKAKEAETKLKEVDILFVEIVAAINEARNAIEQTGE